MTNSGRPPRRSRRLATTTTALALGTLVVLTGCSGADRSVSDEVSDSSAPSGAADSAAGGDVAQQQAPDAAGDVEADRGAAPEAAPDPAGPAPDSVAEAREPAIIATGSVELRTDDVAASRRDVQQVADAVGGQVAGEETTTDRDGIMDGSRLELRVPSDTFDETMAALEDVATTVSSNRSLEDVTTQVVDTEARVRAQQASLTRIEALLGEAEDLAEIVSVEAELTRRQSDLDALVGQLAYLQDATAYSSVTVYLERTGDDEADETEEAGGGFLDGLRGGWDALAAFAGGTALVVGALLPWLVAGAVLGVPLLLLVRRLARRRGAAAVPGNPATGLPPRAAPEA